MPTLAQGRLLVLSFSLVLSSAVFGISIGLLNAPVMQSGDQGSSPYPGAANDWRQSPHPERRDFGPQPPPFDTVGFRNVMILAAVSSGLNMLLSPALLVATFMKRKTIISAVAVEAPCIYVVSFMWLATGAYAEHRVEAQGYFPWLDTPECARYKVLEGIAFINWIQLMLYANTLMTVATICHVRGRRMWSQPASALPTFAAPALTFAPKWDSEHNPLYTTKTNESQVPILGVSSQPPADPRNSSHFRSRLPFLPNRLSRTGIPPAESSPPQRSGSPDSLARSMSTLSDVTPFQGARSPQLSACYPKGELPMYSGPGSSDGPVV